MRSALSAGRRLLILTGVMVVTVASQAVAQEHDGATGLYRGENSVYGAPGYWGVAWGSASYDSVRTYSAYSSSYGGGYGYGYPPVSIDRGPWGEGIWRPELAARGWRPRGEGASYWTFPYPSRPVQSTPPLGFYVPGFGPPANVDW